ncbi:MAG: GNAT family N-acetyltransferase [Sediminibacterium sp.]|nr:GNAT family N-acetyltransferase [Sediminibacterium sp.]
MLGILNYYIMELIRNIEKKDIPQLKIVIDSTGLFPSELLDDMIADYLTNPNSSDIWLTLELDGTPVVIAYCAPERLTSGTYNVYLIAVLKEHQGKGLGASMMQHIEQLLKEQGHRILLVETSGLPEFELTRRFYDKSNYQREAVIREFYQKGEDKIVFWKKLQDE